MHPGENPSIALVNPLLNGNNYHSWAKSMKRAVITKNKFRFLDGSLPMPESFDPSYEAWERCNNLVHSWIVNSVSPSIAQSIIYMEIAAEVWTDLRELFSQGDQVRIAELQHELYSFKQNSLSINEYFTELKVLWEELENYRPFPVCICTIKCGCPASSKFKDYKQQDYVMRFLMGLNDQFSMVRSQILLNDPLPSLNRVFSMVLQHERQYVSVSNDDAAQFSINVVDSK